MAQNNLKDVRHLNLFLLRIVLLTLLVIAALPANAGTWNNIFLDRRGNAHLVTSDGKDIQITKHGKAFNPQLAPDGETAAWLINQTWGDEDPITASNEVEIYRKGRIRRLGCGPLIRDFWFWKQGTYIAMDCGGLHFAGRDVLYEVRTLKETEVVDQSIVPDDQRPAWANIPYSDEANCTSMRVWNVPEVNCVNWLIDATSHELLVSLQKRENAKGPHSLYEFSLYTHYLSAHIEWLPLFSTHEKTLSTFSEGQTGSSVSQTMWTIVGFGQGRCKPYLVESLDVQESIPSDMNMLKVNRHIIRHGKTPRIVLTYRLTQKKEKHRARIYRWRDTLIWDAVQQQFVQQSSKGDPHYVRANIQTYRRKVGSLTCEQLRTLGADSDFGLATILGKQ